MYGMFKDYEEMFFFASEDQETAHRWADAQRHIVFYLSPPGGRKWWQSNANEIFSVAFKEFVDNLIGN